jgi:CubicO group peptidase (beta-lactamase class C family)
MRPGFDAITPPAGLAGARAVLAGAIARRACPAASVEVGTSAGPVWREALGTLTWDDDAPRAEVGTVFDLASLTKVIATTTVTMRLVEDGALGLDTRVADALASWRGHDREAVTVRDLLEHASGLTSHLPFYKDCAGRMEFERAIGELPLECPPRTRAIYSDLGFILLGFLLEDAAGRELPAAFAGAYPRASADGLVFRPPATVRAAAAPTRISEWRGRLSVGEVDDDNAWALGGVAGHAGLFGNAPSVGAFARAVLRGLLGLDSELHVGTATLRAFAQRGSVPGSSRALGWDVMLPTSSCGTRMHATAIGHTGFTGTSLWIDPVADLYVVLLTNRVYPTGDNEALLAVRPVFHDALFAS